MREAAGGVDDRASGDFPLHNAQFPANFEENATVVGTIASDATLEAYLVSKSAVEEYDITSLEDFERPEAKEAFDANGDGKADLVGCPPGWGCHVVTNHHMDVYGLRDHVNIIEAAYSASFADALARHRNGEPVLFSTWTPNYTILEANPAAHALFEVVEMPLEDASAMSARISEGESSPEEVRAVAEAWIEDNQAAVDGWLEQARAAAQQPRPEPRATQHHEATPHRRDRLSTGFVRGAGSGQGKPATPLRPSLDAAATARSFRSPSHDRGHAEARRRSVDPPRAPAPGRSRPADPGSSPATCPRAGRPRCARTRGRSSFRRPSRGPPARNEAAEQREQRRGHGGGTTAALGGRRATGARRRAQVTMPPARLPQLVQPFVGRISDRVRVVHFSLPVLRARRAETSSSLAFRPHSTAQEGDRGHGDRHSDRYDRRYTDRYERRRADPHACPVRHPDRP